MKNGRKLFHWIAGATLAAATLLPAAAAAQCAQFDKTGTICLCPLPGQAGACAMTGQQPLPFASQPKFVYDLPVPIDYVPDQTSIPGVDYYEIQMSPVTQATVAFPQPPGGGQAGKQWLGLVDPLTRAPLLTEVWGYSQVNQPAYALNGISTYPAMNFRATKGRPVKVKWINNAPNNHLFCKSPLDSNVPCAIDRTLMGTKLNIPGGELVNQYGTIQQPDNAMVIHLHGGEIPPDSDGFAELWLGNATTAAAYGTTGTYYTPPTPLLDNLGAPVPGVTSNLSPHFVPPPGSGIAQDLMYPSMNKDPVGSLIANVYNPGQLIRPLGNSVHYNYPMVQRAATIWYHDHALGKTRVNVAAGPAGFFIVQDPVEEGPYYAAFRLPSRGDCSPTQAGVLGGNCYDVPVAIQDRSFNVDGSINFPNGLGQIAPVGFVGVWNPLTPGPNPDVHPQWVPEYFGDHAVINGVIWPRFKVEPRPYRFRLLDGSNARCYTLGLKVPGALVQPQFTHVANEQGYLPTAVVTKTFSMCPGEREDVVIDFSAYAGKSVFLTNTAAAPFPNGVGVQPGTGFEGLAQLMRFDVVKPLNPLFPATFVPGPMAAAPTLPVAAKARQMVLNEVLDPVTLAPLRVQIDGKAFEDAATETPKRGTVERWTIVNTTVDAHPMHLHLVQFKVISRQKYDQKGFMAAVGLPGNPQAGLPLNLNVSVAPFLLGAPRAPEAWEVGWKDTAKSFPGEILVLEARWDGGWQDFPVCATPVVPPVMTTPPAGNASCMCQPDTLNPAICAQPEVPIFNTAIPFWEPVTAGPYVWHCHIVDHEDNEMMRPTLVMP